MDFLKILPLRLIMIAKDLNQVSLAKYFGVTSSYISAIFNGIKKMDGKTLRIGLINMGIDIEEYIELEKFCKMLEVLDISDIRKYDFGLLKTIGVVDSELKGEVDQILQAYFPQIYGLQGVENILADVVSKQLMGKKQSHLAEGYIKWLCSYTKYCFPELKSEWGRMIREIVYCPLVLNKSNMTIDTNIYERVNYLANFMDAAEIMQGFSETNQWDEVERILEKQGHSGETFLWVMNILLLFSPMGVEFVDRFSSDRLESDEEFAANYLNAKKRLEERKNLGIRLIRVLKSRSIEYEELAII